MNLSETAEVLAAAGSWREQGRSMALATIVDVKGSTYRRPGARLLVPGRGSSIGNLSGGCLEGSVEDIAREVMVAGHPRLELYDLTADDEAVWGWGLGCNGTIEVFIEPAQRAAEMAEALRSAIEDDRVIGAATVLASSVSGVEQGSRLLLSPDGSRSGGIGNPEAEERVAEALRAAMPRATAVTQDLGLPGGDLRIFVEVFEPPLRLVVCGAGHDAMPVVRLGAEMGWRAIVVDDREAFLSRERFPEASEFVRAQPIEVASKAKVDERTYVVVMSHNYLRDRDYLRALLGTDVAYIGMLGPRARTERLLDDLAGDGIQAGAGDGDKIHGPAGLDLGGEGPEEIAAAIVAEVLAVRMQRAAGFLRDRPGSIHDDRREVPSA